MSEWKEVRLGDVSTINAGGDAPRGNMSKVKNEKFFIPIYSNGIDNQGLYGFTNKAIVDKDRDYLFVIARYSYQLITNKDALDEGKRIAKIIFQDNSEINISFLRFNKIKKKPWHPFFVYKDSYIPVYMVYTYFIKERRSIRKFKAELPSKQAPRKEGRVVWAE